MIDVIFSSPPRRSEGDTLAVGLGQAPQLHGRCLRLVFPAGLMIACRISRGMLYGVRSDQSMHECM